MLESLTTQVEWWHWIVFGLILITLEMFTGTFFILGLGVAALLVGGSSALFSFSLEVEIILWLFLSLISIILWFRYLRDTSVEYSGQSNYTLDTQGTVEKAITSNGRGEVKFDTPVLGNSLWQATSKESIAVGSRIKIIEIKGQLIIVEAL